MSENHDGAPGAGRRAQIEAMLADYPHVSNDRLQELIRWFRTEASALDVGNIASNPAIAEPYQRFRADHIDRLKPADIVRGVLFAAAILAVVLLIIWRAL